MGFECNSGKNGSMGQGFLCCGGFSCCCGCIIIIIFLLLGITVGATETANDDKAIVTYDAFFLILASFLICLGTYLLVEAYAYKSYYNTAKNGVETLKVGTNSDGDFNGDIRSTNPDFMLGKSLTQNGDPKDAAL